MRSRGAEELKLESRELKMVKSFNMALPLQLLKMSKAIGPARAGASGIGDCGFRLSKIYLFY